MLQKKSLLTHFQASEVFWGHTLDGGLNGMNIRTPDLSPLTFSPSIPPIPICPAMALLSPISPWTLTSRMCPRPLHLETPLVSFKMPCVRYLIFRSLPCVPVTQHVLLPSIIICFSMDAQHLSHLSLLLPFPLDHARGVR